MFEWKAESLRVTGFTPAAFAERVDDVWAAVVGAPPEQISQRPRDSTASAEGSFEGAKLVLAIAPKRVDWVWVLDVDTVQPPLQEFPAIGEFRSVSKPFVELAKTWLQRDLSLNRLALGGVLILPVADREDGYRKLGRFLTRLQIDPVGSSDLQYQINRPRPSRVIDGLRINRLCKWSVALRRGITIGVLVSPAEAPEVTGGSVGPGLSACRLEFDVNTDATRKDPFAANQLAPMLDELVALIGEVAELGDVE